MINRDYIGKKFPPLAAYVEKGQLRFFAKSVGETNPIYTDEAAAKEAGYKSLPAPPTFLFSLNLAQPDPFAKFVDMGIDLNKVLHGSQQFEYFAPVCAGDQITLQSTIVDIFDKKDGALEFIVEEMTATNQNDELVAKLAQTLIVRNG